MKRVYYLSESVRKLNPRWEQLQAHTEYAYKNWLPGEEIPYYQARKMDRLGVDDDDIMIAISERENEVRFHLYYVREEAWPDFEIRPAP